MDRRSFVASTLLSAGILALGVGIANAMPAAESRDHLVGENKAEIENVWWRRRHWRRWHRRHWRRW